MVEHGRLVRLEIEEKRSRPNTFEYGGYAKAYGGIDCLRPASGFVVTRSAGTGNGRDYVYAQRTYQLDGHVFHLVESQLQRLTRAELERLQRSPKVAAGLHRLFPSCSTLVRLGPTTLNPCSPPRSTTSSPS